MTSSLSTFYWLRLATTHSGQKWMAYAQQFDRGLFAGNGFTLHIALNEQRKTRPLSPAPERIMAAVNRLIVSGESYPYSESYKPGVLILSSLNRDGFPIIPCYYLHDISLQEQYVNNALRGLYGDIEIRWKDISSPVQFCAAERMAIIMPLGYRS